MVATTYNKARHLGYLRPEKLYVLVFWVYEHVFLI